MKELINKTKLNKFKIHLNKCEYFSEGNDFKVVWHPISSMWFNSSNSIYVSNAKLENLLLRIKSILK